MFVSFGFVYANVLGWLLPIKLFIFACIIVPVIFTTMFFFQPKSPVYSIQSGKAMEAMEALKALRGSKYDVTAEMKTIKLELSIALGGSNFFQLFKDRGVIRGFIISVTLLILKHLVGSTLVLIFTSEIVKACGFGDIAVKSAVITGGMIQALASFVPLYLVDRVGRRFLLIIGFSITLISSAVLGAFYVSLDRKLLSPNLLNTFSFVPLSALALYWFGYGVGLGNIAALTAVEIFPACFRAKLKCFSEFVNWSASFVVTMTYLQFGEAYGHDLLYFFYCFFSMIGILLVIYVYPEASRKTSLEIFDEIRKRKHIFRRYRAEPIRGLR
ncbi:unnamed protein product [Acanthoscelides obtectus]|nr:unnamed protein product [Acanthoscelides obtectus]CAK1657181.1 Facilitated trehalose transporter Tret1 [Acanthoscelides obtectus]